MEKTRVREIAQDMISVKEILPPRRSNHLALLENKITLAAVLLLTNPAFADRLQAAAERGRTQITSIAQTAAVIGIVLGGLLMSLGASQFGRGVLISGLIGAIAVFGGPALIEAVRSIFGS